MPTISTEASLGLIGTTLHSQLGDDQVDRLILELKKDVLGPGAFLESPEFDCLA